VTAAVTVNTVSGSGPANQAPTDFTLNGAIEISVAENTGSIGTLNATDPESGALTFTFADGSLTNGLFEIVNGRTLKLVNAANLDYEALPAGQKFVNVALKVADDHGNATLQTFKINVGDANEAPTGLTITKTNIDENVRGGTVVGLLDGVDPDATSTFSFRLVDNPGGKFEIVGRELRLKLGETLNYEDVNSYALTIEVSDGQYTFQKPVTVAVNNVADVNHAPYDITLSGTTIAENSAGGTAIGTVKGFDQDGGDTIHFILDDPSNKFEIVDGVLRLKMAPM
jgi:hypothetical protein